MYFWWIMEAAFILKSSWEMWRPDVSSLLNRFPWLFINSFAPRSTVYTAEMSLHASPILILPVAPTSPVQPHIKVGKWLKTKITRLQHDNTRLVRVPRNWLSPHTPWLIKVVLTRGGDRQLVLCADGWHHVRRGEGGGCWCKNFNKMFPSLASPKRQAPVEGRVRRRERGGRESRRRGLLTVLRAYFSVPLIRHEPAASVN